MTEQEPMNISDRMSDVPEPQLPEEDPDYVERVNNERKLGVTGGIMLGGVAVAAIYGAGHLAEPGSIEPSEPKPAETGQEATVTVPEDPRFNTERMQRDSMFGQDPGYVTAPEEVPVSVSNPDGAQTVAIDVSTQPKS
jgi:hypothetical protein